MQRCSPIVIFRVAISLIFLYQNSTQINMALSSSPMQSRHLLLINIKGQFRIFLKQSFDACISQPAHLKEIKAVIIIVGLFYYSFIFYYFPQAQIFLPHILNQLLNTRFKLSPPLKLATNNTPPLLPVTPPILIDHRLILPVPLVLPVHKPALLQDPIADVARLLLWHFEGHIGHFLDQMRHLCEFRGRLWGAWEVDFQSAGQGSDQERGLLYADVGLVTQEVLVWAHLLYFYLFSLQALSYYRFYLDASFCLCTTVLFIVIDQHIVHIIQFHGLVFYKFINQIIINPITKIQGPQNHVLINYQLISSSSSSSISIHSQSSLSALPSQVDQAYFFNFLASQILSSFIAYSTYSSIIWPSGYYFMYQRHQLYFPIWNEQNAIRYTVYGLLFWVQFSFYSTYMLFWNQDIYMKYFAHWVTSQSSYYYFYCNTAYFIISNEFFANQFCYFQIQQLAI